MPEGTTLERLQQRLEITPFAAWLGLKLEVVDDHGITMRLQMRPELQGSPATRSLHGGVTASLIDTASSYAVMARTGRSVATIDMRIDYHRPETPMNIASEVSSYVWDARWPPRMHRCSTVKECSLRAAGPCF